MISNTSSSRRKSIVWGAAAIALTCLCAAKPADAYGWHRGWGGWHGGWGWAGPGVGVGFGYYPGAYAYGPPLYYAPPAYYPPRTYYAPTALTVAPRVVHKTVRHRVVHKAAQTCPMPPAGGPAPSNLTTQSDY